MVLTVDGPIAARPENEQRQDAVRSLAGYLLEIKQIDPEGLQPILEGSALVASVLEGQRPELWQSLTSDPPFYFEIPRLAPSGSVAKDFLGDLANLAVRVAPRYSVADEIVVSTAVRLRSDAGRTKALLDREYVEEVARLLPQDAPIRRLPAEVARAVLDLVQADEPLHFVYGEILPADSEQGGQTEADRAKTWLVGVGERLVAFAIAETPRLVWEGDRRVRLDTTKGYLRGGCRLVGGRWLSEEVLSIPVLLLKGTILSSSKRYFAALRAFCSSDGE